MAKADPFYDFPNIRNNSVCPLCAGPKAIGLVTCWPCYRSRDGRYGFDVIDQQAIEAFEAMLEGGFACTLQ